MYIETDNSRIQKQSLNIRIYNNIGVENSLQAGDGCHYGIKKSDLFFFCLLLYIVFFLFAEFDHFVANNEWEVEKTLTGSFKSTHTSKGDDQRYYSHAAFTLKLKRRRTFHLVSTYIPFVLLALLNLAAHVVPVMSGEKLMLATTTLLAYAVLLNDINRKIPGNSATTSVLGQ